MALSSANFQFLSSFYDQVSDPVCVFHQSGDVIYCNQAFAMITDISIMRFLNKRKTVYAAFESVNEKPFDFPSVQQLVSAGGSTILKFETKKILRGLGQFSACPMSFVSYADCYMLTFKDLTIEEELMTTFKTEIHTRDKKIDEMNQLVEIIQKIRLLSEPDAIIQEFIKYIMVLSDCSGAATRVGQSLDVIFTHKSPNREELEELQSELSEFLALNRISKYNTFKSKRKNLKGQHFHWIIVPFSSESVDLQAIFIVEDQDMLEKFSHQSAIILSEQLNLILKNLSLKELSYTDGLTKLRNSLYFRNQLEEACHRPEPSQLILLDIDFFKKVNDTYGHLTGDAVLIHLGETLPLLVRRHCGQSTAATIARVGGEEFAVLLPNSTEATALELAEKIRSTIESSVVEASGHSIKYTVSVGIASWRPSRNPTNEQIKFFWKSADDALYASKRHGRNRIKFFAA